MSDAATASDETTARARALPPMGPILGLFALYLLTVLGGVALAGPFETTGVQTFENPGSVANVGFIFAEIVVVTALFILITRYGYGLQVLRVVVLAVFGYAANLAITGAGVPAAWILGPALGVAVFLALLVHPEWYVIDAVAVVAGAAIIAQFGNGLGPLPTLIFLVGMAGYDAYAVYVSEHMQQLGGGIGELKLPMMYVVPPTLSFSMEDMGNPFEEPDGDEDGAETDGDEDGAEKPEDGEHDAGTETDGNDGATDGADETPEAAGLVEDTPILLGLGDAIVPGLLAVSAGQFLDAEPLIAGTIVNAPALGAILGSVVGLGGLLVLLYVVERAHAGLPVLNACVILGYLVGAVAGGVPVAAAFGL